MTGTGRGLGRAAAVAMAQEGADMVIVSETPRELEKTAAMIIGGGGTVVFLEGDLAGPEDVKRIVGRVWNEW